MSNISPDYYSKSNIQLSAFIRQNGLDFATGNAIKYIIRHKAKNGKQDILKAMWYLSDICQIMTKTQLQTFWFTVLY